MVLLSTVREELLLFPVRHYLLLNSQDEGQWPEVVIIPLFLRILSSFKIKNRPIHQAIHIRLGRLGDNFQREKNYFRFALFVISMIRNQLSHIIGIRSIWFIMCATYKIDLYTVLISPVDGEILLLPVSAMLKMFDHCYLHYDILVCGE